MKREQNSQGTPPSYADLGLESLPQEFVANKRRNLRGKLAELRGRSNEGTFPLGGQLGTRMIAEVMEVHVETVKGILNYARREHVFDFENPSTLTEGEYLLVGGMVWVFGDKYPMRRRFHYPYHHYSRDGLEQTLNVLLLGDLEETGKGEGEGSTKGKGGSNWIPLGKTDLSGIKGPTERDLEKEKEEELRKRAVEGWLEEVTILEPELRQWDERKLGTVPVHSYHDVGHAVNPKEDNISIEVAQVVAYVNDWYRKGRAKFDPRKTPDQYTVATGITAARRVFNEGEGPRNLWELLEYTKTHEPPKEPEISDSFLKSIMDPSEWTR